MLQLLSRFKRPLLAAVLAAGALSLIVFAATSNQPVKVVWTQAFGKSRAGVVAANPATGHVYAAQEDVPAIAVFDGRSGERVATVPTEGYHSGIAVDPAHNRTYVSQAFAHAVRVIDGDTFAYFDLAVPDLVNAIAALAVDPVAGRLYVIRQDNHDVAVFDTATLHFLGPICAGCCDPYCYELAVNPRTGRLYVTNPEKRLVHIVATASRRDVATVPVSQRPHSVAIDGETDLVYVSQNDTNKIAIIDGSAGSPTESALVDHIELRESPQDLVIDPTTHRLYASHNGANGIAVVDGATRSLLSTIPLCQSPSSMALLPDPTRIFVACDGGHMLMALEERASTFGLP